MKILYITHSNDLIYGAAKSLGYILQNSKDKFDLICSNYLFNTYSEKEIKAYAGPMLDHLYHARVPNRFDIVLRGRALSFQEKTYNVLRKLKYDLLSVKDYIAIKRIIKIGNYDLVYLNSIILYPLIGKDNHYIMHVRELYNNKEYFRFTQCLHKASGLICISETAKERLPFVVKNTLVINNPFDMTAVSNTNKAEIMKRMVKNGPNNPIIFSMIGVVSAEKGTNLVIRAFRHVVSKNSILLIVGNGNSSTFNECRKLAGSDQRIVFCGEVTQISDIYAITDYVLRADPVFAIGRTVYEGLYSGCDIIMQGESSDIDKIFEKEIFGKKIHFYKAQQLESLIECLQYYSTIIPNKNLLKSNIEDYMIKYNDWIKSIVNENIGN